MSNVAVKWSGDGSQIFIGRDSFGHVVVSGSWSNSQDLEWQEWKAAKPSDLLLISLASCTAYDVVMIMGRQRQEIGNLYIDVNGQQKSEPPYAFTDIHIHYVISGIGLNAAKVERAIQLSLDRYCSVAATIRGVANLTYTYEIK